MKPASKMVTLQQYCVQLNFESNGFPTCVTDTTNSFHSRDDGLVVNVFFARDQERETVGLISIISPNRNRGMIMRKNTGAGYVLFGIYSNA